MECKIVSKSIQEDLWWKTALFSSIKQLKETRDFFSPLNTWQLVVTGTRFISRSTVAIQLMNVRRENLRATANDDGIVTKRADVVGAHSWLQWKFTSCYHLRTIEAKVKRDTSRKRTTIDRSRTSVYYATPNANLSKVLASISDYIMLYVSLYFRVAHTRLDVYAEL